MTQHSKGPWRGCQMATATADYWHAAHDFASSTLCGLELAGSGLTERYDRKRTMCPACSRAWEGERTYCTQGHGYGEHNATCIPPAEPGNPELRLLRAIFGLCPDHDQCTPADHPEAQL